MIMVSTSNENQLPSQLVENYFSSFVNRFFKILPMRENNEGTVVTYMVGLQQELFGCGSLIPELQYDSLFLTLISILEYLIDFEDCSISDVRRNVFSAISVCNKLKEKYKSEV